MYFKQLTQNISRVHIALQKVATNAVNKSLTVRNWLIGYYIVEYEQNGEDRAKYGAAIVDKLAENLNVKGLSSRNLKLFRQFYLSYPQISQSLTTFLQKNAIMQTLSAQLSDYKYIEKMQTLSAQNDSPPVGILLVTDKDHTLVQYATAGMNKNLFVQKYLVQLPDKKQLEEFINREIKELK